MTGRSGIITLLTDFGYQDEYVGVMKGVILRRFAAASIIDLSHGIAPQHIEQAAAVLENAYRYFPEKTVHLTVVDPGVGTGRHILLLEAFNHFFIAPDNGILTAFLHVPENIKALYRLNLMEDPAVSSTFHGRDIMAPVAAKLAAGAEMEDMGKPVAPSSCVAVAVSRPVIEQHQLRGEVTGIDHFGNIITSISASDLSRLREPFKIEIGNFQMEKIHRSYGEVASFSLVALINSRGMLEIARNMGNAAQYVDCRVGDPVAVRLLPEKAG
ncbi:MAG: SAM-dependent chlorinase/fluorinase [Desulfopila sp.]|jgi:S-adenosylmethionine hydrolase|nr:SAM-dependent chlorinase/fluorinase [Desulfopila sp.]